MNIQHVMETQYSTVSKQVHDACLLCGVIRPLGEPMEGELVPSTPFAFQPEEVSMLAGCVSVPFKGHRPLAPQLNVNVLLERRVLLHVLLPADAKPSFVHSQRGQFAWVQFDQPKTTPQPLIERTFVLMMAGDYKDILKDLTIIGQTNLLLDWMSDCTIYEVLV